MAAQTRARAAAAGLILRELATVRDVDTLEDVRAEWPAVRALLVRRPELLAAIEVALAL